MNTPAVGPDPAIAEILDRARQLTGDELVTLARAYVDACDPARTPDGLDRRRTLAIAKARAADRADEIRELEAMAAESLRDVGPTEARRALRRFGILEHAERAVTDAVLAVGLRDRLGAVVAGELARPFESVR